MAKKRKTAKKKTTKRSTRRTAAKPPVEHELPGGFWRQIQAILMIALALFFVITWFGHGGSVLNSIHENVLRGIGVATYFIPALLVYYGVKKLRAENNRVSIMVYIAGLLMLIWVSGVGEIWKFGGYLGEWLNGVMTQALDQGFVIFIYIILMFITAAFLLQVSPIMIFKNMRNVTKPEKKEKTEVAAKNKNVGQIEIKVNSGVQAAPAETKRKSIFAHKAPKINMSETAAKPEPVIEKAPEKALVAVNDENWKMPTAALLSKKQSPQDPGNVKQNAFIIQKTFSEFGIEVEMEDANVGPRVTQYTLRAPGGVNLAKIAARDKELAYNLSAQTVRIEAPIPGTQLIGVEVPNVRSASVSLRGIIESTEWKEAKGPLTFAVGKDISGHPVVADLASMRHLLIAGTTGSGKSVMTNTLIMSLLYRNAPSDMRLIIVDPKQVEMVSYNDIPHLLTPVITDTSKALSAMKWAVGEMDRRYSQMAEEKVKKITDYNAKMEEKQKAGGEDAEAAEKMPYIVIVIDEMSDLMMQASKELEPLIVRIAQLGRAAGMHLVLATQKPIVKVITGLIKGNIPSRIAFRVLSSMESRIILDQSGAEKLLGQGDMLLSTEETSNGPERVQGAWTPDEDIEKVTDFLRAQRPPQYNEEVIAQQVAIKGMGGSADEGGEFGIHFDPMDPVVRRAVEVTLSKGKFSTANLQVYLSKGHAYVNRLAIWFEQIGIIGPANGNKPRDLLITSMEEFDNLANADKE